MKPKAVLYILSAVLLLAGCGHTADNRQEEKVRALSSMSELGTVEYTVKKIIKADDDVWYKYGDRKILFSSVAYLKAGIDLKDFKAEDIVFDKASGTIRATFPKAKLLSFNMPADEIRQEYCRVSGFRSAFTPEERLTLKQQGEMAIRRDVAEMGILEEAESNAEAFFTAMFSDLGYEKIIVRFE